jgi:hypothetical protein
MKMKTVLIKGSRQTGRTTACVRQAILFLIKNPTKHLVYVDYFPSNMSNVDGAIDRELVNMFLNTDVKKRLHVLFHREFTLKGGHDLQNALAKIVESADVGAMVFEADLMDLGEFLICMNGVLYPVLNLRNLDVIFISRLTKDECIEYSDLSIQQL